MTKDAPADTTEGCGDAPAHPSCGSDGCGTAPAKAMDTRNASQISHALGELGEHNNH